MYKVPLLIESMINALDKQIDDTIHNFEIIEPDQYECFSNELIKLMSKRIIDDINDYLNVYEIEMYETKYIKENIITLRDELTNIIGRGFKSNVDNEDRLKKIIATLNSKEL